ncbi:MAG TPA: sigma-70 family RNA polymerase sigma factor [Bryobacteraceae bacterium]|jgi:RNA polymerase sigma factor (TIGR02999 family)|nr:sigma-70 family RNA polymerase sigma factor [Bryobacteraceae bacterium]
MTPAPADVAELLIAWGRGDQTALDELMPLVYDELRHLAHRHLRREQEGHTLETTALVHEAYLRLVDQTRTELQSRAHFFAIASRQMRRILVDHYRSRHYAKRGGGVVHVKIEQTCVAAAEKAREIVALDDALTELASFDERKCRVVELRFFSGLSIEDTAIALGVSQGTVMRDWTLARAWLQRAIISSDADAS